MPDSILSQLDNEEVWKQYLEYKVAKGNMLPSEMKDLARYIHEQQYLKPVQEIREKGKLPHADAFYIEQIGKSKKRLVFHFARRYNYVLKLMDFLLKRYDSVFCDNLYSFRSGFNVKQAIDRIIRRRDLKQFYTYKVDISDYFNSIDVDMMLADVKKVMSDDPETAGIIEAILRDPLVRYERKVTPMKKGVMAGIPISGWLADLYMTDMDRWFEQRKILYARYSDDVIVFAKTQEEIAAYEAKIKEFLTERKMSVNPKKEIRTQPGQTWEFLGFSFIDGKVDLAPGAVKKIKTKIRIKAHQLYRWRLKKNAPVNGTVKAYLRAMNNKFYASTESGEVTWCRWYFPLLTTDRSLKQVDAYLLQYARFIQTGRFTKKNYKLRIEQLRELGFESLVNNYWDFKKNREGYLTTIMKAQADNALRQSEENQELVKDIEKLAKLEVKHHRSYRRK